MKTATVIFWLTLVCLVTSWFFFYPGMFYLHDFLHTARIGEVARAISDGHFPVRWSQNFGYGYGMPLFEFYAPLPYYVGAIFILIGIPALFATKMLFILCNVGTVVGSYYLGKSLYGRMGGLLTAAAISLAPYRAVNLYVRGALSELWGMMAAVWILYFTVKVIQGKSRSWIGLVVSLFILFTSHNLTTLLFVPFAVVTACLLSIYTVSQHTKKVVALKNLSIVACSYVIAATAAAFYLVPAFLEKNFTQVTNVILGGYFDYAIHFVYLRQFFDPSWGYGGSNWGPTDDISFFLGYGQLICIALSVGYLGLFWFKSHTSVSKLSRAKAALFLGFGVLAVLALVLSTQKSQLIWSSISLLQYVQFPWRYLSIAAIFIGVFTPLTLYASKSFVTRWFIGWFLLLIFFMNAVFFRPDTFLADPSLYYSNDATFIRETQSAVLPDYLPADLVIDTDPPAMLAECSTECSISVLEEKVQSKRLQVASSKDTNILIAVADFPGWTTTVNGKTTTHSSKDGVIQVPITQGVSEVLVKFESTPIRDWSDKISLIAFGVFLVLCLYQYKFQIHEK